MLSQVSIFAENKKGRLQNITSLLQKENINIWGSITNDSAEYGIIRMVVSNPEHAEKVLAEAGYLCRLTEVLGVELDDEVGAEGKEDGTQGRLRHPADAGEQCHRAASFPVWR